MDEQPVLWLMAQLYNQVRVVELQCRQQKIEEVFVLANGQRAVGTMFS